MTSSAHTSPDGRPTKTGADLYDTCPRVLVHDTPTPNDTVRVTVEHPSHDGGVQSWLRYDAASARESIRTHLAALEGTIVDVTICDDADIGITKSELLETPVDTTPQEARA